MTAPWIAVIVAQSILMAVFAAVQIGILRRVLPHLESRGATPSPIAGTPAVGAQLPPFTAALVDGVTITSAQIVGQPFVLLFAHQACPPCERLLGGLEGHPALARGVPVFIVIDPAEDNVASMTLPRGAVPLLESQRGVSRAMGINATPTAVAVDDRGTVVSALVPSSPDDLDQLVQAVGARSGALTTH
jgi:hypothetical protein